MNQTRFIIAGLLALALAMAGCSLLAPDETVLEQPGADSGTADFTRFVSIGNSLTAGYQSGALYASAQEVGFASLLAMAMGSDFEMPLIADPGYYDFQNPIGHLRVTFDDEGDATLGPTPWSSGEPAYLNAAFPAPYQNLGVPGALTWDLLYAKDKLSCASFLSGGSPNPHFDIVLRSGNGLWGDAGTSADSLTVVEQVIAQQATFVSIWIGNNEILGAATAGSGDALVSAPEFQALYEGLLGTLVGNLPAETDFVVANIPSVTSAPFFTTVPWFVIDPDRNPVDGDPVTEGIQFVGLIAEDGGADFQLEAGDYVTIKLLSYDSDENGTPDQQEGLGIPDLVLTGSLIAMGMPPADAANPDTLDVYFPFHNQPVPGALTLSVSEAASIAAATTAFNGIIADAAATHSIPVVNVNALLAQFAAEGANWNGEEYSTDFVTGGLFSLDGVHPSNVGHALIAEAFIETINGAFGADLKTPSSPILRRVQLAPGRHLEVLPGTEFMLP